MSPHTWIRSGFLLLQLDMLLPTIELAAAALASERRVTVILDPAPARPLPETLLARVSVLTPNESEALVLLDRRGTSVSLAEAPGNPAVALLKRGPRAVILKLGAQGAYFQDASGGRHFPGFEVNAVDATAAGDTFGGALGVALAEGRIHGRSHPLRERRGGALRHAPRCPGLDARAPRRARRCWRADPGDEVVPLAT